MHACMHMPARSRTLASLLSCKPPCVQIDRRLALEVFEQDCMQAIGLMNDKEAEIWRKKEIRYNTKNCYTQNK